MILSLPFLPLLLGLSPATHQGMKYLTIVDQGLTKFSENFLRSKSTFQLGQSAVKSQSQRSKSPGIRRFPSLAMAEDVHPQIRRLQTVRNHILEDHDYEHQGVMDIAGVAAAEKPKEKSSTKDSNNTVTIIDNRTGKKIEVAIKDGTIKATALAKLGLR